MKPDAILVFSMLIMLSLDRTAVVPVCSSTTVPPIISPPQGEMYHGVYPGGRTGEEDDVTAADLQSYEQTVGKTAAWVYFSNNWYRDRQFPLTTATWIRDLGSVPFIRLMLRDGPDEGVPNRIFTLDQITEGYFDEDLREWARGARDFGSPLLVEYGTEVNGGWFPWNGQWNGAGNTAGYGNSTYPDGPERFRDTYRHIVDTMRQAGASNIMWVFHVNGEDFPDATWNRFEMYYPGNEYIDWIGLTVYGATNPTDDSCNAFRTTMDPAYQRLIAMAASKPVVVLEFGVTSGNPLCDQAVWAQDALTDITNPRRPAVIGFSWWNEAWPNGSNPNSNTDMRVQDNKDLATVFRTLVGANPNVLGRVIVNENQMSLTKLLTSSNISKEQIQKGSGSLTMDRILITSSNVLVVIFSVVSLIAFSILLYAMRRRHSLQQTTTR